MIKTKTRAVRLVGGFIVGLLIGLGFCLLFSSCAGFPATREAGIRRMAEAKLKICRKGFLTSEQAHDCYSNTQLYCLAHGMERTCGEGFQ